MNDFDYALPGLPDYNPAHTDQQWLKSYLSVVNLLFIGLSGTATCALLAWLFSVVSTVATLNAIGQASAIVATGFLIVSIFAMYRVTAKEHPQPAGMSWRWNHRVVQVFALIECPALVAVLVSARFSRHGVILLVGLALVPALSLAMAATFRSLRRVAARAGTLGVGRGLYAMFWLALSGTLIMTAGTILFVTTPIKPPAYGALAPRWALAGTTISIGQLLAFIACVLSTYYLSRFRHALRLIHCSNAIR